MRGMQLLSFLLATPNILKVEIINNCKGKIAGWPHLQLDFFFFFCYYIRGGFQTVIYMLSYQNSLPTKKRKKYGFIILIPVYFSPSLVSPPFWSVARELIAEN